MNIQNKDPAVVIPSHFSIFEMLLLPKSKNFSFNEIEFCYQVTYQTIESILNCEYTKFDALTTTNCCHGLSLFLHKLLDEVFKFDLESFLYKIKNQLNLFERTPEKFLSDIEPILLPHSIIELCRLYILCYVKKSNNYRTWETDASRLQKISLISMKLCRKIVSKLQTYFSNKIAKSYFSYINETNNLVTVSGINIELWGKYICSNYLKIDKRGRYYASCLYSMQVVLGYLIFKMSKILILNDIRENEGLLKSTEMYLFQGDGHSNFMHLSKEKLESLNEYESIIVFSGCSYPKMYSNTDRLKFKNWFNRISEMILCCDIYYPQFPKVTDDLEFDSSKIVPEDAILQSIINKFSDYVEFSPENAALFCLTHVYVASIRQIVKVSKNQKRKTLPYADIPNTALVHI